MLVARLEPSLPSVESVDCDNGEDVDSTHLRDSLPSALVDSPWAEAALGSTVVDGGLEDMDPHWYHINYVNFKTWEFTLLRLMHVDTYPEMNEMTGANQDVYELEVHEHPQVSTSHRFFANLDLHLRYIVSWFTIISDDKPVFKDLFRAKTVCVSETTLEGVCDSYAWHGEISEEQRRTALETRQKKSQSKRAASRRTGHSQRKQPGKRKPAPQSRTREGQNHLLDLEEEEEEEEVQPGDLNQEGEEGEEEEPEFDQLVDFAEMGLGLSSGDQEGAQDQDGDLEHFEHAGLDLWDDFYEPDVAPASSSADTNTPAAAAPEQEQPEPSGGVSGMPPPDPVPASEAPPGPVQPAESPRRGGGGGLTRDRDNTEEFNVYPFGILRYLQNHRCIVAVCADPRHGDCRKSRTVLARSNAKTEKQQGQGRPCGYLMAWLQDHARFQSKTAHSNAFWGTRESRTEGRKFLYSKPAGKYFASRHERPRRPDEADEPADIA